MSEPKRPDPTTSTTEPGAERAQRPDGEPSDAPTPAERPSKGQPAGERGGPKGPEPTRYGDWEKNGRCFDF